MRLGSMAPADVANALRHIAKRVEAEKRSAAELESRLHAIRHESEQWRGLAGDRRRGSRAGRELAEIERVRSMLERSVEVTNERVGALDLVVAAFAGDATEILRDMNVPITPETAPPAEGLPTVDLPAATPPPPAPPQKAQVAERPPPTAEFPVPMPVDPPPPVRGAWAPPPSDP